MRGFEVSRMDYLNARDSKFDDFVNCILRDKSLGVDETLMIRDLSAIRSRFLEFNFGDIEVDFSICDVSSIEAPIGGLLDNRRAMKIKKLLEKGNSPQPVYFLNGRLIEGRHRLIAFNWHGVGDILVVNFRKK